MTASRAGAHPGTHEVGFDSAADTITLRHTARSREGFARGALAAARWVVGKKGWFEFRDVLVRRCTNGREIVDQKQKHRRWNMFSGCGTALVTPFRRRILRSTKRRCAGWCGGRWRPASISWFPAAPRAKIPRSAGKNTCAWWRSPGEEAHGPSARAGRAGGYNTAEIVALAKAAAALGVDGILSVTPYYNKPTQEGFTSTTRPSPERSRCPVVLYNVPRRTGANVEPATLPTAGGNRQHRRRQRSFRRYRVRSLRFSASFPKISRCSPAMIRWRCRPSRSADKD